MTWMELCDPSLTHRKSRPVDYLKIVKVLNGVAHAKTAHRVPYITLWEGLRETNLTPERCFFLSGNDEREKMLAKVLLCTFQAIQ
jgi:hypothetical protein